VVWQPDETRYPTTCWLAGSPLGDSIRIPLPDDAPQGAWYISLTAFADVNQPLETVGVLQPALSLDTTDRQVGLGPIMVSN
jgi:hypothetical protein